MSALLGIEATKVAAAPPSLVEQGKFGGAVRVMYDKYVFLAADFTAGDTLKMGAPLPAGATILKAVLVTTALGGSTSDLDVGWNASDDGVEAADTNGIFAAVVCDSAVSAYAPSDTVAGGGATVGTLSAFFHKKFESSVQIVITANGTCSNDAGDTVELEIWYTVE